MFIHFEKNPLTYIHVVTVGTGLSRGSVNRITKENCEHSYKMSMQHVCTTFIARWLVLVFYERLLPEEINYKYIERSVAATLIQFVLNYTVNPQAYERPFKTSNIREYDETNYLYQAI